MIEKVMQYFDSKNWMINNKKLNIVMSHSDPYPYVLVKLVEMSEVWNQNIIVCSLEGYTIHDSLQIIKIAHLIESALPHYSNETEIYKIQDLKFDEKNSCKIVYTVIVAKFMKNLKKINELY
ncbi:hypothetical protein [Candidatus Gromoviella agglomerans]|uniref:hypothetical protein n=1 Tax=Candidatus Gromoviella agglomerans TaxID=2806609 RepID=UPI001E338EE3|nr:hypothetical protein [Candidatus Gromoviella agglomerans]UFX98265.1 hypothetical protein Gromo_00148 [Candidatus Gromoviella agglomerans]